MSDLAHYLENWTDLPVVDRTALAGLFEMHSRGWQPMNLPPPPPGASGTGAEFGNLSTLDVILSSFGLELHREEESVPFYTVERIDLTDTPPWRSGVYSALFPGMRSRGPNDPWRGWLWKSSLPLGLVSCARFSSRCAYSGWRSMT
jgi:hypothetical protein